MPASSSMTITTGRSLSGLSLSPRSFSRSSSDTLPSPPYLVRERHDERRPAADFAFDLDRGVVQDDELLHHSEAEPRPALRLRREERFENARSNVRRYAVGVVLDTN